MMLNIPSEVSYICTIAIIGLAIIAITPKFRKAAFINE